MEGGTKETVTFRKRGPGLPVVKKKGRVPTVPFFTRRGWEKNNSFCLATSGKKGRDVGNRYAHGRGSRNQQPTGSVVKGKRGGDVLISHLPSLAFPGGRGRGRKPRLRKKKEKKKNRAPTPFPIFGGGGGGGGGGV